MLKNKHLLGLKDYPAKDIQTIICQARERIPSGLWLKLRRFGRSSFSGLFRGGKLQRSVVGALEKFGTKVQREQQIRRDSFKRISKSIKIIIAIYTWGHLDQFILIFD